ncbi:MAG: hypothetical protein JNL62_30190, partial [Bryobacterales bacterium]|nr:hypothetical protein [Bryobacterales bacterium]
HPDYRPHYGGGVRERDSAYHQGPVWAWLLGHYALAWHRVTGDAAAAQALLEPVRDHLADAALGSVSEIFDAAPPHTPRGARRSAAGPDSRNFCTGDDMKTASTLNAERTRLESQRAGREDWRRWGPYLAERAWGTVREDYSPHGNAWEHFDHDQARSRAYRWNEDGMGGICDEAQHLCFA